MLTHIHITNLALVDNLSLDFSDQLSVLTGETGAGKSIWIDAIHLALGQRAEAHMIRHQQPSCDITLCFDTTHLQHVNDWLDTHELRSENECIIRRVIKRNGPSRSFINGTACTLNTIKELSQKLILIHSQHHHQALLKPQHHAAFLDTFASNHDLLTEIQTLYQQWQQTQAELNLLKEKELTHQRDLELLHFQHQELTAAAITNNEWATLSATHQKMHNHKQLIEQLQKALQYTAEDEDVNAVHLINLALSQLNAADHEDPALMEIKELLNTSAIHLQEASSSLSHYYQSINLSPEALADIETRINVLHDLARKHHTTPEQLPEVLISLEQKINELEHIDTHIDNLTQAQQKRISRYNMMADKLSKKRNIAQKKLDQLITERMQHLGMEGGSFSIKLTKHTNDIHPEGHESIAFWIKSNPGQPFTPIQKVASGGELSRISLILQVLIAEHFQSPTLIFDEVDTGISGETAHAVGELLSTLSQHTQVLCITHLPQIAARGQSHYKVTKTKTTDTTHTDIQLLNQAQRIEEIARMLDGKAENSQSTAHAKKMLSASL